MFGQIKEILKIRKLLKAGACIIKCPLTVRIPDLSMVSQWYFVADFLENKTIRATIEDENFKKKVLAGDFTTYHNQIIKAIIAIEKNKIRVLKVLES